METHRAAASGTRVRFAALTVSDTRTPEDDASGALICETLKAAGHVQTAARIVPDEPADIRHQLKAWTPVADVVVTTGGTGLAGRDATVQTAQALIEAPIPGFGELFRMLSYDQVGAAAMLSRALGGVYGTADGHPTLLFCCPGSTKAVRLALDKLIVPELEHLVWEIRRQRG